MHCRDLQLVQSYNIDQETALRRMVSVSIRRKNDTNVEYVTYYEGIESFIRMSMNIPVLWVVVPFLWFVNRIGIGGEVYDWFAHKRRIIPVGQCEDDVCTINR